MKELSDGIFVGAEQSCRKGDGDWAVVHACKHPCHQDAVGYSGSLSSSHPEYLVAERGTDLYLNMVDMARQLRHEYTEPIISAALDFTEKHIALRNVLIHCNQGMSRSPCLALLYLAKRDGAIPGTSFTDAKEAFRDLYPRFHPGNGINKYLHEYWAALE